tara:strand:+ start:456 stop:1016 length:561 start_codon:yes stop_codon:yes gene_type:complete
MLMKEFMSIYRGYGQMLGAIAVIAGIATFGMMWLVDANVLSRKLLNKPVMGSVEISQALLVFCIMLGMPYAQVSGAHLRVTMIIGHAPRRISEVLFSLSALVGCIVFAFLAYSGYLFALRSWNVGEEVWGATIRFPLWPVKGVIPIGAGLLSLQFLLDAIRVLVFRQVMPKDDIANTLTEGYTCND